MSTTFETVTSADGAALALEAAQRGMAISKLAVYEPSYVIDGTRALLRADRTFPDGTVELVYAASPQSSSTIRSE